MKEYIIEMAERWTKGQIEQYIYQLQERVKQTNEIISILKSILKKRTKSEKVRETGERDGR